MDRCLGVDAVHYPEDARATIAEESDTMTLLGLSTDEISMIALRLADPLAPRLIIALKDATRFSMACRVLRLQLGIALALLRREYKEAMVFCRRVRQPCAEVREMRVADWTGFKRLKPEHCTTLGMLARADAMPRLESLHLDGNPIGDDGIRRGRGSNPEPATRR